MTTPTRAETILGLTVKPHRWNAPCVIQPEQAKALLENQLKQRPVSQAHVEALVSEIKSGRFALTNEGVAFDESGSLFDGQHRLWACFESGFSIEVLCCFNEPRSNFDRIGTVIRRRTVADHLIIEGMVSEISHGNLLGAAGRFIWAYDHGLNPTGPVTAAMGWCNDSMREVLARHPHLIPAAEDYRSSRMLFPRGPTVALIALMREASIKAAIFENQIMHGENLVAGDPALTLRASATSNSFHKRGARTEMTYKIARAWNAFYEGRKLRMLYGSNAAGNTMSSRARKDGMDAFPRIAGLPLQKEVPAKRVVLAKAQPNSKQPPLPHANA